jgi:hypothetical protein
MVDVCDCGTSVNPKTDDATRHTHTHVPSWRRTVASWRNREWTSALFLSSAASKSWTQRGGVVGHDPAAAPGCCWGGAVLLLLPLCPMSVRPMPDDIVAAAAMRKPLVEGGLQAASRSRRSKVEEEKAKSAGRKGGLCGCLFVCLVVVG